MYEDRHDTCHAQVLGVTGKVAKLETRLIPRQAVISRALDEVPGSWFCTKPNAIGSQHPSVSHLRADVKDLRNTDGIFVCSSANHLDREPTKKEHGRVYLAVSMVQKH
jgi:hypothetical protein